MLASRPFGREKYQLGMELARADLRSLARQNQTGSGLQQYCLAPGLAARIARRRWRYRYRAEAPREPPDCPENLQRTY